MPTKENTAYWDGLKKNYLRKTYIPKCMENGTEKKYHAYMLTALWKQQATPNTKEQLYKINTSPPFLRTGDSDDSSLIRSLRSDPKIRFYIY